MAGPHSPEPMAPQEPSVSNPESASRPDDRLSSWKEIAAYLGRDVRTVQRWERTQGLPVHRHRHSRLSTAYALKSELDAWWHNRPSDDVGGEASAAEASTADVTAVGSMPSAQPWWTAPALVGAAILAAVIWGGWR